MCPEKQYPVLGTQYSEKQEQLTPCRKGELAEIAFLGRATALGYIVTKPFGHAAPYDFLIERGGRVQRIQVKSCWVPRNRGPSLRSGFPFGSRSGQAPRTPARFGPASPRSRPLDASSYAVRVGHFDVRWGCTAYKRSEVDFIAAYVAPEDAWYVIPIRAIRGGNTIALFPHVAGSKARYEKYREAWELLDIG